MAIETGELELLIKKAFPESEVILKDLVGDGDHYEVTISQQYFMINQKLSNIV